MVSVFAPVEEARAKQMNAVTLAFVGDAVYTLFVRERLVRTSKKKAGELNTEATKFVSARGQSETLERLLPLLTEDEAAIYRRGRNAKKATKSKNATNKEYVRSTGFEALIGYLYLTGRTERIIELFFPEEESES